MRLRCYKTNLNCGSDIIMQFTVVTGLSGSGKTQVLKFLEDKGFFCIDNLPPALIPKLSELLFTTNGKFSKVALVIDMRVGDMIDELLSNLEDLKKRGYSYTLLFINASDEVLIKRYKESRHLHPTVSDEGLLGSIHLERKRLAKIYNEADYVINTSDLSVADLQKKLKKIYANGEDKEDSIKVNIIPFGFKYGLPPDADLVFDVRCFPNPFYIPSLKEKTGNDKEVQEFVMRSPQTQKFYRQMYEMIYDLLPLYYDEGKSSVTIAIGCTGGKHRSVTLANLLGEDLKKAGYDITMIYRDIAKGKQ